ncbi:MAG: DUF4173 domain-containing protein [Chloroflexota bacterium]|nr:DUF4173 domain-containing protein [Chloroflexota bacterium]
MPAIGRAVHVVAAGAALGVIGQLLFFEVAIGINFPIAIALLMTSGWLVRRPESRIERRDLWLAPAAVTFASFAAIRADPVIVLLDALTALGLAGAALASLGQRSVLRRPFGDLVALGIAVAGWVGAGAVPAIGAARRRIPASRGALGHARPALPVLRGLLIALPVVLVFASLFSAADAVFARMLDDATNVDVDLGSLPARAVLAAIIGWLAIGGLALAASRAPAPAVASGPSYAWRLGRTEVLTVLVAVDLLFAAFVALQAAYLFGGLDTLGAIGMTYSEYARRGFFELVAVAILAGGLVVAADRLVRERSRALVAAAIVLASLTAVVLVSAALRLRLYQEAYGWTELRLYVLATIVLLGCLLVCVVLALLADRVRWTGHAALALGLTVGFALSVIGPARFITEQNVARALDPTLVPADGQTGLDTVYALSLGDDRIPDLVRVLPALEAHAADYVRDELRFRLQQLRTDPALEAWQSWNLGRVRALAALEAAAEAGRLD